MDGTANDIHGLSQYTGLSGEGDVYVLSGWTQAKSVMSSERCEKPVRLVARVDYNDGTHQYTEIAFNAACEEEQFVSGKVDTRWEGESKPYDNIAVMALYEDNVNEAAFWDLCLQKDVYGNSYAYDKEGNLKNAVDQAQEESSFTYSGADLSKLVEPTGNFKLYAYDEKGNVIRADTAGGVATTIGYDEYGNAVTSSTFEHGFEEEPEIGETYILVNKKSGLTMTMEDGSSGSRGVKLSKSREGEGSRFELGEYVWDMSLRTLKPEGTNLYLGFEEMGDFELGELSEGSYGLKLEKNEDGSYRIHCEGTGKYLSVREGSTEENAVVVGDPEYRNTNGEHPEQDWYLQTADAPEGERMVTSVEYTENGAYAEKITDERGEEIRYEYDEDLGLVLEAEDPEGNKTVYSYDEENDQLKKVEVKSGETVKDTVTYGYHYDRLTRIEHNGIQYRLIMDGFGNLKKTMVGEEVLSENEYESNNGNLTKMEYGNGEYVEYEYDSRDRIRERSVNGETEASYEYDKQGKLYRYEDLRIGYSERYEYDMAGRLRRLLRTGSMGVEKVYGYGAGNLLEWERTRLGNREYRLEAEYDEDSRPIEYRLKRDGIERNRTEYTYDGLGRLEKSEVWSRGKSEASVSNEIEYLSGGSGKTTGLVEKLTVNGRSYTAEYDGNGNIVRLTDSLLGATEYEYDALNQLTKVKQPDGTEYTYVYDAGGNLKQWNKNGQTQHVVQYAMTGWKDQIIYLDGTAITYDGVGNPLTWRQGMALTWESGRQLSSLQKGNMGVSYEYTAEGRRSKKTVNGTETRYVWDGDRLLSETKGNETIYYLYHGSSLVGLEYKGSEYYYEYNLQGDVAGIVNSSGQNVVRYTYSAWGKPESCTGNTELGEANPIRYRGYYYDAETGFYYLLSRYYDPDVGRFLNADNAIPSTGESVQGYNLFVYCFNNPVNMDDQSGHWPQWLKNAAKAVGSFVTKVKAVFSIPTTAAKIAVASTVAVASGKATVEDVVNDVKNYDFSNKDEQKCLDAKVFSSYNGTPVLKHDISGITSFSVSNTIILNKSETVNNGGIDTVKHEWGHTVQQSLIGTPKYMTRIAAPSIISCIANPSSKTYYSLPWERTADFFGGANRSTGYYAGSDVVAGWYLIMP